MVTFNNAAEYNEWDRKAKLAHLHASLSGAALELLREAGYITYDQLVTKLKDRFGTVGLEQRYRTELRCRRRKEGQSIRELAQEMRRLMLQAYPGESDSRLGQHTAMDAFINALADLEIQVKICDKELETLEDAVKAALWCESSRAAVESSVSSRQRSVRRIEQQPIESQPAEAEVVASSRHVPADVSRKFDDTVKHKRRGELSPALRNSPRKRERRVRAASQPDCDVSSQDNQI